MSVLKDILAEYTAANGTGEEKILGTVLSELEGQASSLVAMNKSITDAKPRLRICIPCNGTGTWKGTKWTRTCFRCKGKGYHDQERVAHNHRYDSVAATPMKTSSCLDYGDEIGKYKATF